MKKYLEQYKKHIASVESFKQGVLSSVVVWFKAVGGVPLTIGNMVYFYVKDKNGNEVPAYCYLRDFGTECTFHPIYDKTGENGWSDFEECCRIFDVIMKKGKRL